MSSEKIKVIVMGGKGTAVNVAEGIFDAEKNFNAPVEFLGFAFDDESFGESINGFPILCKTKDLLSKYGHLNDVKFIFQMYHQDKMKERAQLIKSFQIPDEKYYTFVHPSSFISKSVQLGVGTVVYAHCAIHSNTIIGKHNMFSAFTSIGHDCKIHNHVFTATHVCIGSSVEIGDCTFMGQNVGVRGGVYLEGGNIIGMGSNLVSNVKETNKIFLGNPAKAIREIKTLG